MEETIRCIVVLAKFTRMSRVQVTGDLLRSIITLMEVLDDDGLRSQYYLELLYLHDTIDPGELILQKAINASSKIKDTSRQAEAYSDLSAYYLLEGDLTKAGEFCSRALSLAEQTGNLGQQAWGRLQLSQLMHYQGRHESALVETHKARSLAQAAGRIFIEAHCIQLQAFCSVSLGDFRHAAAFCREAMPLHDALGLDKSSPLYRDIQNTQAEIFLRKTEYSDARTVTEDIVVHNRVEGLAGNYLAFALCNLAIIDIALGNHESPDVLENLRVARQSFSRATRPLGLIVCDLTLADLEFIRGDYESAETLCQRCLRGVYGDQLAEANTWCFERMADIALAKGDTTLAFRRCVVFFSFVRKNRDLWATHQSLRRLGDVLLAQGDVETASNLFQVALDGFTFMGVHRGRGDCLIRLGDIWTKRGDPSRSREMWKKARSLFEKSSQLRDVARCDERLEGRSS